MAISFVGSILPVGANNGGNVTLNFTGASGFIDASGAQATLQQNDLVLAPYASSIASDQAMATSSSGWTNIAEDYSNGTTYDTNLAVLRKFMGATPDTSIVFTGPGGSANGTIGTAIALRGVDTTTPLDVAVVIVKGTGTTRPNPGSITPLANGAWLIFIGAGAASAGAAFTAPAGLSTTTNHFRSGNHAETNDIAIGLGLKNDWSSGAFDCPEFGGGNVNAANSWVAVAIVLRPAVATTDGDGAAAGAGAATGVGTAVRGSDGAAAGSSTVAGAGDGVFSAAGAAAGAGSAAAVGLGGTISSAAGSADGAGSATGAGASVSVSPAAGDAAGAGTASGTGHSVFSGAGASASAGGASAPSEAILAAAGAAAGVGSAIGTCATTAVGNASSGGGGGAVGVGSAQTASVGLAVGSGQGFAQGITDSVVLEGAGLASGSVEVRGCSVRICAQLPDVRHTWRQGRGLVNGAVFGIR